MMSTTARITPTMSRAKLLTPDCRPLVKLEKSNRLEVAEGVACAGCPVGVGVEAPGITTLGVVEEGSVPVT